MHVKGLHDVEGATCLAKLLDENSSNLLGLFWVQTLSTLDLLSILEYNDGWEFLELEVVLGSWEFLNIDLERCGVMSVTLGSPIIKHQYGRSQCVIR
jgi:hypothetical protein